MQSEASVKRIVEVLGIASATTTANATLACKTEFAVHHALSAAYFARRCACIEPNRAANEMMQSEHRAYVLGAINGSFACVEARINEVFRAARDKDPHLFKGAEKKREILGVLCEDRTVERLSTVSKYQLALTSTGSTKMSAGDGPASVPQRPREASERPDTLQTGVGQR